MAFDKDAFDLFPFLSKLNRRDLKAFDGLTEEGKKAAHPLVIMRWLSGTSDEAQIVRLNTFVNRYVFSLGNDKALLFKLIAASCTGNTARSSWIKGPGSHGTKLAVEAIKAKYECSTREATEYLGLLQADDVILCATEAGWDKDAIKRLTTELGKENDTGTRSTTKSGGRSKK